MENNLLSVVTKASSLPTKQELLEMVDQVGLMFTEPDPTNPADPMKTYLFLKRMESFAKDALKQVEPWAVQQAKQYDEKERGNLYNSKVVVKPGKPHYDFTKHSLWMQYFEEERKCEEEAEKAASEAAKPWDEQAKMAKNNREAYEKNLIIAGAVDVTRQDSDTLAITIL